MTDTNMIIKKRSRADGMEVCVFMRRIEINNRDLYVESTIFFSPLVL